MVSSLCGKRSCPSICVRVCHCPAGLARSHWLAGMLRNKREMSRPRASLSPALSPAREYDSEFESETRDPLNQTRSRVMTRANWYHYHAGCTRSQALKLSWAEWKQVPSVPERIVAGFKVTSPHNFGALNTPNRKKQTHFLPTRHEEQAKPPLNSILKLQLFPAILCSILAFIAIIVLVGFIINGTQFIPDYPPEPVKPWTEEFWWNGR